jgi:ribosomal protein S18 acetylase RimI-like enzyme
VTTITYAREQDLGADEYIAVIASTYMREHRAVGNPERIGEILRGSNLIVTARGRSGAIVGVARGISDGAWVCYLADLCVRDGWERRGIGTGLLEMCYKILGPRVGLVLLAYPEAVAYYRKLGLGEMTGFFHPRGDES